MIFKNDRVFHEDTFPQFTPGNKKKYFGTVIDRRDNLPGENGYNFYLVNWDNNIAPSVARDYEHYIGDDGYISEKIIFLKVEEGNKEDIKKKKFIFNISLTMILFKTIKWFIYLSIVIKFIEWFLIYNQNNIQTIWKIIQMLKTN